MMWSTAPHQTVPALDPAGRLTIRQPLPRRMKGIGFAGKRKAPEDAAIATANPSRCSFIFRRCADLRLSRPSRSEEHTSEPPVTNAHLVCRLLLEKKKNTIHIRTYQYIYLSPR